MHFQPRIVLAAYGLQYVNSAANPFLYVFFSDTFKRNVSFTLSSEYQRKIFQVLQLLRPSIVNKSRMGKETGESALFMKTPREGVVDSATINDDPATDQV